MAAENQQTGVILMNVGTPDSPEPKDVRRFLKEFLSDPRVLDINPIGRWLLLNLIILPFRPKQSGEAYEEIWTDEGSPIWCIPISSGINCSICLESNLWCVSPCATAIPPTRKHWMK